MYVRIIIGTIKTFSSFSEVSKIFDASMYRRRGINFIILDPDFPKCVLWHLLQMFPWKRVLCSEGSGESYPHYSLNDSLRSFNVLKARRFLCKEGPLILTNCVSWTYLSSRHWLRMSHQFAYQSWQTVQFGGQAHRRLWAHSLTFLNLRLLFHKIKIETLPTSQDYSKF